jgi:phosphoglycolate phosphatase
MLANQWYGGGSYNNGGYDMLLIFDLDGTLFHAKPAVLQADRALLAEMGVPVPDDNMLLQYAGRGLDQFLRSILPVNSDLAAARMRYIELVRLAILDIGELFPGVLNMVKQLHEKGHELLVCSNSPEEYIKLVLEHTGVARFITGYYSAEKYASKAELIREIIKPGSPAVVIGDTHGDVEAAHENSLPAIAVTYGYGNKDMLAKAEYFADTPEEIVARVRGLVPSP